MSRPRTLFDKIWDRHAITETAAGDTLLYVDRCYIHEGVRHAFDRMQMNGESVRCPSQVFAFSDHYAPTHQRHLGAAASNDPAIRGMLELADANANRYGIRHYGLDDPNQGILHVVPPELGITQPGLLIVGADSHTSTHGALGALAFGLGASETRHVMTTQTLWQRRPRNLRITVNGQLPFGCTGKDLVLAIIARIGAGGGVGYAIEYAGEGVRSLSMEGRMTVCNMSIEAGARAGMMAPDDTTFDYVRGKPHAPRGDDWDAAVAFWRELPSDPDARFDHEVFIAAAEVAPMVTWGTSPEHACSIDDRVPDPAAADSARQRADHEVALEYMDLKPGQRLTDVPIDRVFIGSCTNGRIEDLRAAARVAERGRARITAWVVPGSMEVKRQAEAEGLHRVFEAAGFEWRAPGCSLCTAINGDEIAPGERCASTSNRNFQGRQGKGGRTHLVSPSMAAAAAIAGRLADVRELGGNG
ncbi:MAG: 3-isopropylmalate dehydratase large subunit [Pseudomonadota bacterium]